MKIIRFLKEMGEKTGLIEDNQVTELSCSTIDAINSQNIDNFKKDEIYEIEDVEIKSPVSPSKIVCIGLNYKDHAAELKMELPDEPILFIKPQTSVIGHLDSIIYPDSSSQVDYEAELGIILSREAKNVKAENAEDFIGGYTVLNDVTARDLQRKDGQWTRAKSFDTFCPIGPYIETDLDPMNQNISLTLNGEFKQKSNTKNMIFNVYELVEFISNIMTLKPGDVIATGTPPGVGPMNGGDIVEVEIEGIGVLRNFINKKLI
jgi:2-keto-4-pentenoate hydratase/2-oxohepta-3-ene-1,7-dioic acid hydratase in catechol pathway